MPFIQTDHLDSLCKALHTSWLEQGLTCELKLTFTYQLLVCACPFTLISFCLMWSSGQFSLLLILCCSAVVSLPSWNMQNARHLQIQDVSHFFQVGSLHYFTVQFKASKTDPFCKEVTIKVGCTTTQVCSTCTFWLLLQNHQSAGANFTVHFF